MTISKSLTLVTILFLTVTFSSAQNPTKLAKRISPDALVADLYRESSKDRSPFFQTKNRALVDKYFQKNLADLIWKDAVRSKGEVGAIDGDPLYNAQDMDIEHFSVHPATYDKGTAKVRVTFENFGKKEEVGFLLSSGKRSTVWKIANIQYSDGTNLLGILNGSN